MLIKWSVTDMPVLCFRCRRNEKAHQHKIPVPVLSLAERTRCQTSTGVISMSASAAEPDDANSSELPEFVELGDYPKGDGTT